METVINSTLLLVIWTLLAVLYNIWRLNVMARDIETLLKQTQTPILKLDPGKLTKEKSEMLRKEYFRKVREYAPSVVPEAMPIRLINDGNLTSYTDKPISDPEKCSYCGLPSEETAVCKHCSERIKVVHSALDCFWMHDGTGLIRCRTYVKHTAEPV